VAGGRSDQLGFQKVSGQCERIGRRSGLLGMKNEEEKDNSRKRGKKNRRMKTERGKAMQQIRDIDKGTIKRQTAAREVRGLPSH
jgi:hypothetical protein